MRLQRDASGDFILETEFLAERLGTPAEALIRRMRLGQVTSRVEEGAGEDAGHVRLTVRSAFGVWAAVLDENGLVLEEAVDDIPPRRQAP